MNINSKTFDKEGITLDYITIKFQSQANKTELEEYLFTLGFNIYLIFDSKESPKRVKSLFVRKKNNYAVKIYEGFEHRNWQGYSVMFPGKNASYFYHNILKKRLIDWQFFSGGTLSRLDLKYIRKLEKQDNDLIVPFLSECQTKIEGKYKNRNVNLLTQEKGNILRVGNRKASNYLRIYRKREDPNHLHFEHEMKGKFLERWTNDLMELQFEDFENRTILRFYKFMESRVDLESVYVDWLAVKLRPFKETELVGYDFKSHYLNQNQIDGFSLKQRENFLIILKLLSFCQTIDYQLGSLKLGKNKIKYREVTFYLRDFVIWLGLKPNYYQFKKLLSSLDEVRTYWYLTSFTEVSFRSIAAIPGVEIIKDPSNKRGLRVDILLAEDIFIYDFPFLLPNKIFKKTTKHKQHVQLEIIKQISQPSVKKVFYIDKFFRNYPSILSNQKRADMKRYFIEVIRGLQDLKIIQKKVRVIDNDKFVNG